MNATLVNIIHSTLDSIGLYYHKKGIHLKMRPGSAARPIGGMGRFLEDVKARGFAPRGIIDVGANNGNWAMLAHRVFPEAAIMMIEPLRELESKLLAVQRQIPQCQYHAVGVGPLDTDLDQTVVTTELYNSTFLRSSEGSTHPGHELRKTSIRTLDGLVATAPGFSPDLVKLDVQGYELEALKGGASLFGVTEMFVMETSQFRFWDQQPLTRECIAFMYDRGYELYDVADYLRRPSDGALGQLDLAFVKVDGIFRKSHAW
jgi:FkbM family methyltransferase